MKSLILGPKRVQNGLAAYESGGRVATYDRSTRGKDAAAKQAQHVA